MNQKFFMCRILLSSALLVGCDQLAPDAMNASPSSHGSRTATNTVAVDPVVVELFQSQGCSSCPPANAALNAVADRNDLIALSFAVTYWDRLGWKDIFGDKAYTQRQYDYAHAMHTPNVYTPQVIINGTRAITGSRPGELVRAIAMSKPLAGGPSISKQGDSVKIGSGEGSAEIWLVRYDPRSQNVAIRSGENEGQTLPHKNIVRQLDRLGAWRGASVEFTLTAAKSANWNSVILLQRAQGGPIIAAKKI